MSVMVETKSQSIRRGRSRPSDTPEAVRASASVDAALLDQLEAKGYRGTDARRTIVDLIRIRNGAFRATGLLADARSRNVPLARASVFRTLELLQELGVIERLDFPDGSRAYVRCDPSRHHHHLVCSRCHRALDIEGLGMSPVIRALERRTGYRIATHRVELYGLCPACQGEAAADPSAAGTLRVHPGGGPSAAKTDCEPLDPA